MSFAVDDTADFGLKWLNEEQSGSKYTDYNHLKVLLIGEDFLSDEKKMQELLDLLEQNRISRAIPMCLLRRMPEKSLNLGRRRVPIWSS